MTKRYAEGTSVPAERSQTEVVTLLRRFGAEGVLVGWESNRAVVGFTCSGRAVRFLLEMPSPGGREFAVTPSGRARTREAAAAAHQAEVRRRWRSLVLAIKAKLEVVASGISTFEEEFLAHTVLPGGVTVAEQVERELAGQAPPRLLAIGAGGRS